MLYPLSYGRSAATGIPRAQRRERLPVEPAQTEIPVRNVAKDYRLTLPRRKSALVTHSVQSQTTISASSGAIDLRTSAR